MSREALRAMDNKRKIVLKQLVSHNMRSIEIDIFKWSAIIIEDSDRHVMYCIQLI